MTPRTYRRPREMPNHVPQRPDAVFLKRSSQAFRNHKARAKKYGHVLGFTLEELRAWLECLRIAQYLPCAYCKAGVTADTFCLDHVTPIGRRVDVQTTFSLENLEVCCADCNLAKDRLNGSEFRGLLAAMEEWPPQARTNLMARLKAGARRVAGR